MGGSAIDGVNEETMELRILGAHNMESKETRFSSHIINGELALDAGGLTRSLTFDEQKKIRALILSHRHFDHVRDLLPLGLSLFVGESDHTVHIYAIQDTLDFVRSHLLDSEIYPDFTKMPSPENPKFRLKVVKFFEEFQVLGYTVKAVPMPHAVPAAGFQLTDGKVKLFYTGDAGKGMSDTWKTVPTDVLLTEVTYGNEHKEKAIEVGHLTPELLGEALADFQSEQGHMPRVIVAHINPPWEDAVRSDMKRLSQELGIEFTISHADMTLTI